MEPDINIIAIESSCDDTSVAIMKNGKIIYHNVATQKIHSNFGGVVPELASREHMSHITPLIDDAFRKTNIAKKDISAISFANQPGLLGPLFVGANFAKAYAMCLKKPLIAVNHLHAHIMANFLNDEHPNFPFLCLMVSGGHSQIVHVISDDKFIVLGETIDDAVGEAFDKIAKMMHLEYPGGKQIDMLAQKGDPNKFIFPYAKIEGLNYSFSGIKTAFKYFLEKEIQNDKNFLENNINDICASIQNHLIDMLFVKLKQAIKQTKVKDVALAGGVAANKTLRAKLQELAAKMDIQAYFPEPIYCTDNAAMVGVLAYRKYLKSEFADLNVQVYPN